jgi:regulator of protease activity HflC (stomatin/prohibitin superfamily)
MTKTYQQIKASVDRKLQAARDKEKGIDRKKLAIDAAVAAVSVQEYRLALEYYPKIRWALKRKVTRILSENDKAAGFSDWHWETVAADLHTRVKDTAEREAKRILKQRHPYGNYTLTADEED